MSILPPLRWNSDSEAAPLKNKLEDESYLDVLLEWGTAADVPLLVAEIRRLRALLKQPKQD